MTGTCLRPGAPACLVGLALALCTIPAFASRFGVPPGVPEGAPTGAPPPGYFILASSDVVDDAVAPALGDVAHFMTFYIEVGDPSLGLTVDIYDPGTDTWVGTVSQTNAPAARAQHAAVWTGSEMIVWGGSESSQHLNTGGRYDPVTDTWLGATPTAGAPSGRQGAAAVWTGKEMIAWGGWNASTFANGARYVPPISLAAGTMFTDTASIE